MKHKTAELEGALLDAAVALAEGRLVTEADEHPNQPGHYWKTRKEWGEHIVRWYAREGEDADGAETDEEGGWEAISHWGSPSTNWRHGGPIIEREKITVGNPNGQPGWTGAIAFPKKPKRNGALQWGHYWECGPTPLVAAMRTYVTSKLGEEVELP
jgi:hypothetical protein